MNHAFLKMQSFKLDTAWKMAESQFSLEEKNGNLTWKELYRCKKSQDCDLQMIVNDRKDDSFASYDQLVIWYHQ